MRFERLDKVVTLLKYGQTTDSVTGDIQTGVVKRIRVWAEFKSLQGNLRYEGMAERSRGMGLWIIRWRDDVEAQTWGLEDHRGRIWEIHGEPREGGRRQLLELLCQRMTSRVDSEEVNDEEAEEDSSLGDEGDE